MKRPGATFVVLEQTFGVIARTRKRTNVPESMYYVPYLVTARRIVIFAVLMATFRIIYARNDFRSAVSSVFSRPTKTIRKR